LPGDGGKPIKVLKALKSVEDESEDLRVWRGLYYEEKIKVA
jgi:hypothetical protein